MSKPIAARLAWALWALFVLLVAGFVLLEYLNGSSRAWADTIASLVLSTLPTVGAVVASRRSRNPLGWLILVIALSFAGSSFSYNYALYTLKGASNALPGGHVMAWFSTWVGLPGTVLLLTFVFLLFPTGHLPSPRWRPIAWLAGAILVLNSLTEAFAPGNASWVGSPVRNPLGIDSAGAILQWLNNVFQLVGVPIGVLCAASIVLRFRRARGDERQQLKWLVYASTLVVIFFILNLAPILNPSLEPNLPEEVLDVVFALVIGLPAVAMGVAILKYRLYDIDLIIRRTLIYGVLTAALAFVYWGSVLLLQTPLRPILGEGNDVAIVISTLLIAALFLPLRRGVQTFIDRQFYRRKYDAAKTLEAFSATLRDEVDLDTLTARLLQVVDETMQPAHESLWLRSTAAERVHDA